MKTTSDSASAAIASKEHVRVVLNGGKRTMDSATIPVQWFFSHETAQYAPTHVLIIEHDAKEVADRPSSDTGRRYVRKVTDRIHYLQVFSPGTHTITVCALDLPSDPKILKKREQGITKKDGWKFVYNIDLDNLSTDVAASSQRRWPGIIAYTTVQIEVPDELFATRPKGPIGTLFWKWVNLLHSEPPRDECKYRARMMWAFSGQIVLALIYLAIHLVVATIASLLSVAGRLAVLFFGYRPSSFIEPLKEFWTESFGDWCPKSRNWTEYLGQERFDEDFCAYRVWKYKLGERPHYMPITGIEVVGWAVLAGILLFAVSVVRYLAMHVSIPWRSLGLMVIEVTITMTLATVLHQYVKDTAWFQKLCQSLNLVFAPIGNRWRAFQNKRSLKTSLAKQERRLKQAKRDEARRQERTAALSADELVRQQRIKWMADQLALEKAPNRVMLSQLPKPLERSVTDDFRIVFWATKAKVCRPFAK